MPSDSTKPNLATNGLQPGTVASGGPSTANKKKKKKNRNKGGQNQPMSPGHMHDDEHYHEGHDHDHDHDHDHHYADEYEHDQSTFLQSHVSKLTTSLPPQHSQVRTNGNAILPPAPPPPPRIPAHEYEEAIRANYPNYANRDDDYDSDEEASYNDVINGYPGPDEGEQSTTGKKKKNKKKKKGSTMPEGSFFGMGHLQPPKPQGSGQISKDRIWNTSTQEERERIKHFWLSLAEDQRRSLVKVEKEAVLKKMKEQQKHSCSCTVCGRKRTAIEEELEVLYDAYYEELEQYANQQQIRYGSSVLSGSTASLPGTFTSNSPSKGLPPSNRRIEELPDLEEDEEEQYEEDDNDYEDASEDEEQDPRQDFFNFGNSLTVQGGILTVADDLLKNDGKKFIEMMEQLAERRMAREEEASQQAAHSSNGGPMSLPPHNHSHAQTNGHPEYDDYDDDEEDYDDDEEDDEDDDDEGDAMTEEQRMEEGRRMFQIFAARMFEQRVLCAYRERVAQERQDKLLQELEEEERTKEEQKAKKAKDKEKKKDKKRSQKQQKEEERLKKESERAEEEAALKAAEEKKAEETRKRKEEQRLKREAEKKAAEEDRLRKEEEKRRRLQEEKEREAERERKRKDHQEKERKKKEDQARKMREEKEAKEKERKDKEDRERREKEQQKRVTEEKERMRKDTEVVAAAANQQQHVNQTTKKTTPSQLLMAVPVAAVPNMVSPRLAMTTPALPKPSSPPAKVRTPQLPTAMSSPNATPAAPRTNLISPMPTNHHQHQISLLGKQYIQHPMPTPLGFPPNLVPPPGVPMPPLDAFSMSSMQMNPPMGGSFLPNLAQRPLGSVPMGFPPPPQPGFGGQSAFRGFPGQNGMNGMPIQPPPGVSSPGLMRGFAPPRNTFMGDIPNAPPGISNATFAPPMSPFAPRAENLPLHARKSSGSFDENLPPSTPRPIHRPTPIQRPANVVIPHSKVIMDELSTSLGSSALLGDDEPEDLVATPNGSANTSRRSSNVHTRSIFGQPIGQPFSPSLMSTKDVGNGSFGLLPNTPNTWGAPTPLGSQPNGGWGNATAGWSIPENNTARGNLNRRGMTRLDHVRLLATQVCADMPAKNYEGFVSINDLLSAVNAARGPNIPHDIRFDDLEIATEIEGDHQNGGGLFEVKNGESGKMVRFDAEDETSNTRRRASGGALLGEIGSPTVTSSFPQGFARHSAAPGAALTGLTGLF